MKTYFSIAMINGTWCVTARRGSDVRIYAKCPLGMHTASAIAETARHDDTRGCTIEFDQLPRLVQHVSRSGLPCFRVAV